MRLIITFIYIKLLHMWWWLEGSIVCYAACKSRPGAFCKRRSGHFGCHRAGSGFSWSRKDIVWGPK